MLTDIEIDGERYHAQFDRYDDELGKWVDPVPILEENGDLIPLSICICFAYESSECCCNTTSWINYDYDYD
jgi:hypothetical protein